MLARYEDLSFRSVIARTAKLILDISNGGQKPINRRICSIEEMARLYIQEIRQPDALPGPEHRDVLLDLHVGHGQAPLGEAPVLGQRGRHPVAHGGDPVGERVGHGGDVRSQVTDPVGVGDTAIHESILVGCAVLGDVERRQAIIAAETIDQRSVEARHVIAAWRHCTGLRGSDDRGTDPLP